VPKHPHLVAVSGVWPHTAGNREAANVVCHQILHHLAKAGALRLTFQYINWAVDDVPAAGRKELDDLAALGVTFAPAIALHKPTPLFERLRAAGFVPWGQNVSDWVPGAEHRPVVAERLSQLAPDVLLTIWSEVAQNLIGPLPFTKVAYAGNPDYKVFSANRELAALEKSQKLTDLVRAGLISTVVKRAHAAAMRGYDRVLNVAHNDAMEYRSLGIRADYIQNMWPSPVREDWSALRDAQEIEKPLRIVGNVGNLSATGNSFGLLTIARDLVPRLKERLGSNSFEVHLFGGGSPRPAVAQLLADPHIRVRGFVDDLDAEIMAAPVFLVANNHHRFKVGHTRFLHAWSLGACCVGFADSRLAMPELKNGVNVLLREDVTGVVDAIALAAADRGLRRRLGAEGVATLKKYYAPATVVARLQHEILGLKRA